MATGRDSTKMSKTQYYVHDSHGKGRMSTGIKGLWRHDKPVPFKYLKPDFQSQHGPVIIVKPANKKGNTDAN